jgi:hypothetical protein
VDRHIEAILSCRKIPVRYHASLPAHGIIAGGVGVGNWIKSTSKPIWRWRKGGYHGQYPARIYQGCGG